MKNSAARDDRSPPGFLRRIGGYVDRGITSFFSTIARFVALHPYAVILVCVFLGLALGAGIARINVVTASEDLYTHQGTQGFKDRDYVQSLYGYGQITDYIYATEADDDYYYDLLNVPDLIQLLKFYEKLITINATYKGQTYNFEDSRVCYRPSGPETPCDVISVLDFWNYSREAILSDLDIPGTVSNASAVDRLGRPLPASLVMGGITRDNSTNKITGVKAFQLIYRLQNNKKDGKSDSVDKVVEAWQKAAVPVVRKHVSMLKFFYNSEYAREDEASKTITGDVSLLVVGYILLIVYGMVVLSKGHPVESRAVLALANIGSIALAVIGSYGFCSLVGVNFSLVTQILALLLLGLGTDDMLVTMAAHEETGLEMPNASVVDRVVATVSRARRGIVVASLTTLVAFCTGASSTLPALRDFMIYAAVGVVLVVIFQSTFYVACITLDLRRQRANKMDIICCFKSKSGPSDGCCGREFDSKKPSISQRVIGIWLPRIILNPFGKIAVLGVSLFLVVMAIIGALNVTQNFDDDWFVPDGSWLKDVLKVRNQFFVQFSGTGAIPFSVYTKNSEPPVDYFDYQAELLALSVKLQEDKYVSSSPVVDSWYVSYIKWIASSSFSSNLTAEGRPQTSAIFYESLKEYIGGDGKRYKTNVIFSNVSENVILSSAIDAFFVTLDDSVKQVDGMDSVRDVAKTYGPNLKAFAYTFPFLFYEGYAVILWDTLKEVIIAGSVIFVILLVLLADVVSSILVGLMVVLIDIELIGFIYWSGLYFNSVTSINMLLAIGIAVDYSAFTAFSFLTRIGTRNERVHAALANFGVAVFNGGFTMFLAILPAAGAQSYIFQTFFKMFAMIVLLGLWHGLFALPVLLSFIGSEPFESAYERADELEMEKTGGGGGGGEEVPRSSQAMDEPPLQTVDL